jgi:hypothetical protein
MKKIIISLVIIVSLLTMMSSMSFAATVQHWNEAEALYNLDLFSGTSATTFSPNLTATLNRTEGVIFIIKLFKQTHHVQGMSVEDVNSTLARFSDEADIPVWARAYVAWAVANHMVIGTNRTEFSPLQELSGSAYCTMILRDLGYEVTKPTFEAAPVILQNYGTSLSAPDTKGSQIVKFSTPTMLRDGAVGIALNALNCKFASTGEDNTGISLLEYEINNGSFTAAKAKKWLVTNNPQFKIIDLGIWANLEVPLP